jgi:hypothetical protein
MTHAGRKPLGPALVEHLEGSPRAKQRLEIILETIAGRITVDEACQCLAIKSAMFYRLRTDVLEAGLARLEPCPMGRPAELPSAEESRVMELQHRVEELESDLKLSTVREEIARVMPHLGKEDSPGKKTIRSSNRRDPRHVIRERKPRPCPRP